MWQTPAAAWSPPPREEREAAGAARRSELRDFIAIRRALLRGGTSAKAPAGPPPKQQWGRQRAVDRSPPAAAAACVDWQAIQQQAHQGFEAMLREAGLPVNAGFSRPASFTAAAAGMQHPAAQLAPYYAAGYGVMAAPQAPWVGTPGNWAPPSLPPGALTPGEPAAWQEQQGYPIPQQQPYPYPYGAAQLQAPQQQHAASPPGVEAAGPWQGEAAGPGRPPSALLTQQQQLLLQAAAARCHASISLPASPGRASPLRPHSARPASAAPPVSHSTAASLRRSSSMGDYAAADALTGCATLPLHARLASLSASCSLSHAAEEQLERQQHQRLLKLDSDLVASASWRAERGSQPAAAPERPPEQPQEHAPEQPAEQPAELAGISATGGVDAAPQYSLQTSSTAGGAAVPAGSLHSSMSSGSRGSSLASSALQALVAAAEAEDVPRMESDALEARPGSIQLQASFSIPESNSFAAHGGLSRRHSTATPELPPGGAAAQLQHHLSSCSVAPPAGSPAADPLAAAAAALARFEQLQSQLQQLQAGLPAPPAGACADRSSPAPDPLPQPPAQPAQPEEAASPVAKMMRQAESFLEQAQQLLQRLNLAAASPQQRQHPEAAVCSTEPQVPAAPAMQPEPESLKTQHAQQPAPQQEPQQPQHAQQPAPQQEPQQPQHCDGSSMAGPGTAVRTSWAVTCAAVQPLTVPQQDALSHVVRQLPVMDQPATTQAEPGHQGSAAGVSVSVPWQEPQPALQPHLGVQPQQAWSAVQQEQQPAWEGGHQMLQPAAQQQQVHRQQQQQPAMWTEPELPAWHAPALYEQPPQAWLQPQACYSYAGLPAEPSAAWAPPPLSEAGWEGGEEQQPLHWGQRQRWEAPGQGQRGRQAARHAGGYAQRRQAASAAGSRPGSAQQRSPERAGGQVQQGSYLQAARVAKERAARQAAERERLRQQNEAARQAARLKAAQEKQRQEQEERERQAAAQQAAQRRQLAGSMRSSLYLQRLRVQRSGRQQGQQQQQAGDLPDWAKAARPLPPLLPPRPAGQAPPPGHSEGGSQHRQQPDPCACSPAAAVAAGQAVAAPAGPSSCSHAEQFGDEQGQPSLQMVGQPQQQQVQQPQHRTPSEEEQLLQAALASLDARLPQTGSAHPAAEASLLLSSRSNSVLQEQLRSSLARLDGRLAGVAAGRAQQKPAAAAGIVCSEAAQAVLQGADGSGVAAGSVAAQPAEPVQQASAAQPCVAQQDGQQAEGTWGQLAASPVVSKEAGQLSQTAEQQPLQWRLRRRSLAGAMNAAVAPAPVAAAGAVPADAVVAAADSVCHINIANVGKPCHVPAAALQPLLPSDLAAAGQGAHQLGAAAASSSSGKHQQSVLPPLRKEPLWPSGQQGKPSAGAPSAPVLRTAARAAARPSRMQPLQGATAASYQQSGSQQQQWHTQWPGWEAQQQQGLWAGWGQQQQAQQQQQQQAQQWWQHFPPGWQQYQQPLQQWSGAVGGLAGASYGGTWHWAAQ